MPLHAISCLAGARATHILWDDSYLSFCQECAGAPTRIIYIRRVADALSDKLRVCALFLVRKQ
jgi:hypothetical protein